MKKLLTLTLTLLMLFSVVLTGCGGSDEATIIGQWEIEMDMAKIALAEMDEEQLETINVDAFKGITFKMTADFKKDGTLKVEVDETSVKAAANKIGDKIGVAMEDYFEAQLEEAGISMTVEEYLEALEQHEGKTIKEIFLEGFNAEDIIKNAKKEGKYEYKNGKLYTSDEDNGEINKDKYEKVKVSDDELKFIGEFDNDGKELDSEGYPMIFKRVK